MVYCKILLTVILSITLLFFNKILHQYIIVKWFTEFLGLQILVLTCLLGIGDCMLAWIICVYSLAWTIAYLFII